MTAQRSLVTVVQVKTATPDPLGDVIALAIDAMGHRTEWRCPTAYVGQKFVVDISSPSPTNNQGDKQ